MWRAAVSNLYKSTDQWSGELIASDVELPELIWSNAVLDQTGPDRTRAGLMSRSRLSQFRCDLVPIWSGP